MPSGRSSVSELEQRVSNLEAAVAELNEQLKKS
jgi:BMFP domain-containing protein YqiC